MTAEDLRATLRNPEAVRADPFSLMQRLCAMATHDSEGGGLQELVLRALEHRDLLGSSRQILDGLVRELGLFPFLREPDDLGLADRIAYEFHRPQNLRERGIVFHRPQARVFRELMSGKSVVLSAPTSFGKSLIVDAVVASGRYRNIMVIVPTIALIDETRRRLASFAGRYRIITHPSQRLGDHNIMVFTQERVLDFKELDRVDFFVVDEFYKLSPGVERDENRSALLNQAFYELVRRGAQFYMLGPSVTGVSPELKRRLSFSWIYEPYQTVVSELHPVDVKGDEMAALDRLCRTLNGPTIIFCKSPSRAAEVARALVARGIDGLGSDTEILGEAVAWIGRNYHPDWHFVEALRHGIGIHHGRIPRALAQYVVRAFDEGRLRYLICTSTLIEGVNTKAENIVVLDDRIDRRRYDFFTFNNIRGRSGRMFQHFVGHVYLFHEPPQEDLPLIDVPALTQSAAAPESLLLQLADEDLEDVSRDRIRRFGEQVFVSVATIRANVGVDPDEQISCAKDILEDLRSASTVLRWSGFPSYEQLGGVCRFIWKHFGGARLGARSVTTPAQLTYRINRLRDRPRIRDLILEQQRRFETEPDEAVQNVLDFMRLWANFHFPRLLRALDRIQRDVFERNGLSAGNYEFYAAQVENFFLDSALVALDEYGVPLELGRRMDRVLAADGDLDAVLARLSELDVGALRGVTGFETELLVEAKRNLGGAGIR